MRNRLRNDTSLKEAFLKAYTNLLSFRGDCKFSSWLYKLTTNLCLDFIRKRNRQKVIPLVYEDEDGDSEYMAEAAA